jgi:hypothetical protein
MSTSTRRATVRQPLHLAVLVPAFILLGWQFTASARTRDLTDAEARALVMATLRPDIVSLPKFGLDPYAAPPPGFYAFEATAEHPDRGSPVIGQFAVNRATGDVWRLVVCEKLDSTSLRQSQAALRKKIGLGPRELRRLSIKAPCEP